MTYKFRLRSGSLELEIEGDKEFLESKLSDLSWLDAILEKLGELGKPVQVEEAAQVSEKPSFVELASLLNPKTNWEKFLSIAYYLYRWEGKDLTYEDVEKYYGQARWPMPRNMWDVMSNLIREGYMEDAGKQNDRKAFRILRKGIEYVESALKRGELP
ncbi:MAG: hypothetical protein DRN61_01325 [Thaumarchaeota archaeon]|nr:MAG: hypothetical protein DRN61_01325 [Nitrososphaerota archaeon]HDD43065.1 hypothetical protein [Nitrososphaeria archaeon]